MINHVVKRDDKIFVMKTRGFIPKGSIGPVPDNIPQEDWPYLQASQSNDEFGNPKWNITVDTAAKAAVAAEKSKKEDIAVAYQTMSDEVDARLYEVFRTIKPDYATAEYETWKDMKLRPAAYAGLGLKIDHQLDNAQGTELFSPGSALDTAEKITQYATRKIELAEEYGTYRVQRIQQFKNERQQILNSQGGTMLGKKEDEKKVEEKKVEEKKAPAAKNPLDEKKVEKDTTNEAHFSVGDEVKIKDLVFVVDKVGGLELVLKRKDFK